MSTHLKLEFEAAGEKTVTINYPYANAMATPANVKALTQAITANGEIFADPPLTAKSAGILVNTVIPIDIS